MRSAKGSLTPFLLIICSIVAAFLIFGCRLFFHWLSYQTALGACDAAALAAANEIAKIVIKDPNFGYVSLSDHPSGTATLNAAGEAMPVTGINTIISSCRFNLLLSRKLGNAVIAEQSLSDLQKAKNTCRILEQACLNSIKNNSSQRPVDRNGHSVNAYASCLRVVQSNLSGLEKSFQVELSFDLGWLESGYSSMTALVTPTALAELDQSQTYGNEYRAFVPIGSGLDEVYFAGLSPNAALVSSAQFRQADGKRVASVPRAVIKLKSKAKDSPLLSDIVCTSAACPGGNKDLCKSSTLFLSFPHGRPGQLYCLNDLLSNHELSKQSVCIHKSVNGDFPDDESARLVPEIKGNSDRVYVSELISRSVYDWLRSCHSKTDLQSTLNLFQQPFPSSSRPGGGVRISFDENGSPALESRILLPKETVHDQQLYAVSHNTEAWGHRWTFKLRDQVSNLGLVDGGKHAGLPMKEREAQSQIESIYPKNTLAVSMEFSAPN